ncbi:hypothetical protein LCGC14_2425870, partial [marine sediment metagenome]
MDEKRRGGALQRALDSVLKA